MKRLVIALTVLTLALGLAGITPAVGAGPKTACFQMGDFPDVTNLTFKALGTASTPNGKVKVYAVHGNHSLAGAFSFPVSGTAYMLPGSSKVHWSVTGSDVDFTKTFYLFSQEGFWDTAAIVNPVGKVSYTWINPIGTGGGLNDLDLKKCDCVAIPW